MEKKCLIADYDPWDIKLLSVFAERFGFQVVQAYQGQDIIGLAQATQPDVILLERSLPGNLTANEILRLLNTSWETRDIPVIVTVSADQAVSVPILEGSASFLTKPATYEDFVQAMADVGINS